LLFHSFLLPCLQINLFTLLESPAVHGGDDINKTSIPHRKGKVKAPSFLTGFSLCLMVIDQTSSIYDILPKDFILFLFYYTNIVKEIHLKMCKGLSAQTLMLSFFVWINL
jgi:hypothetical protein